MIGGIYSHQKCPICGGTFQDDGRKSLVCPKHPEQKASKFVIYFRGIFRRFNNYEAAARFLNGLRFKTDEGSFDKRDYKKDNPLGFSTLADKYLEVKKQTVKPKSFNNLKNYLTRAINNFNGRNIKEICYADLEDFILAQDVSDKTRANIKSCLHNFQTWLAKRKIITIHQIPEFPEVKYELGYRATISKEIQEAVLNEVYDLSYQINPKIWLAIKWLCTYISVRPGELITLKEGEIDPGNGYLFFPHPKEKRHKLVPILEEDVEIIKSFPRGLPDLPFFRHPGGIKGCREGEPFGQRYLWKWWKKACDNLGIQGVDLYGGTRHSSAKALRQFCSPEEIKRATMHSTNKAFERYFQIESEDLRDIYKKTRDKKKNNGKVLEFKRKEAKE